MKIHKVIKNGWTFKILDYEDGSEAIYYMKDGLLYDEGIGFPSNDVHNEYLFVKNNWKTMLQD